MYSRLKHILTGSPGKKQGSMSGPNSLNYVFRKNAINRINEENNAFLNKLSSIKPTVPDVRSLERIH